MDFKTPWILLLIPFVILFFSWLRRLKRTPSFRFSSTGLLTGISQTWKIKFNFIPFVLRLTALVLFVVALAGPRQVLEESKHKTEGIEIVLTLDCSGSMAAEDFMSDGKRYNRLMIIKNVVKDFIARRHDDRIALIAFGGLAFTVCPLTTDYDWLLTNLDRLQLEMFQDQRTAIGSAISSSLNRLKTSKAKSKIIILLTDGVSNAGKIEPVQAAKMAQAMNVKIYTIGAGSNGLVPFPARDLFGRTVYQYGQIDLDEDTLKEIARLTNGRYFRAADTESLRHIYQEIDSLEKTTIEETGYKEYKQLFVWFLAGGLFLLLIEIILSNTVFLRIP